MEEMRKQDGSKRKWSELQRLKEKKEKRNRMNTGDEG